MKLAHFNNPIFLTRSDCLPGYKLCKRYFNAAINELVLLYVLPGSLAHWQNISEACTTWPHWSPTLLPHTPVLQTPRNRHSHVHVTRRYLRCASGKQNPLPCRPFSGRTSGTFQRVPGLANRQMLIISSVSQPPEPVQSWSDRYLWPCTRCGVRAWPSLTFKGQILGVTSSWKGGSQVHSQTLLITQRVTGAPPSWPLEGRQGCKIRR